MSGIQKHGDTRTVRYFGGYFLGIFTIAVDEMRHLRWVNEGLARTDPTSLGRADRTDRAQSLRCDPGES